MKGSSLLFAAIVGAAVATILSILAGPSSIDAPLAATAASSSSSSPVRGAHAPPPPARHSSSASIAADDDDDLDCDDIALPPSFVSEPVRAFASVILNAKRVDVAAARCMARSGLLDLGPSAVITETGMRQSLLALVMRLNFVTQLSSSAIAAFPEYWRLCAELIERGANPAIDLGNGITPLHVAGRYRQFELSQVMVEAGADPHALDHKGKSPLVYVMLTTDEVITMISRFSIDNFAAEHPRHTMSGMFPMGDEFLQLSPTGAEIWRDRDPSASTSSQSRARRAASEWTNAFILLLVQSAEEATRHLHRAVWHGNDLGVAALRRIGADVLRPEPRLGRLPHHLAAIRGYEAVMRSLGADSHGAANMHADTLGHTPASLRAVTRGTRPQLPLAPSANSARPDTGGGWSSFVASELVIETCAIEQRGPDIDADEFISSYVLAGTRLPHHLAASRTLARARAVSRARSDSHAALAGFHSRSVGKPVILRGLARDWPLRQRWTRKAMKERFGDIVFTTSAIPYGADFGVSSKQMSLGNFIDAMPAMRQAANESAIDPYYIFDTAALQSTPFRELENDVEVPPPFLRSHKFEEILRESGLEQGIAKQFYVGPAYSGAPPHFHTDAWNVLAFGLKRWYINMPDERCDSRNS